MSIAFSPHPSSNQSQSFTQSLTGADSILSSDPYAMAIPVDRGLDLRILRNRCVCDLDTCLSGEH
jgi:hypothetical protein